MDYCKFRAMQIDARGATLRRVAVSRVAVESKRIFNAARMGAGDAPLKDCYVASAGDVTGVTSDVTPGDGDGPSTAAAPKPSGGASRCACRNSAPVRPARDA